MQAISDIQSNIQDQENTGIDLDLPYLDTILNTPALLPPGYETAHLAGGKDYKYVIPGRKESIRVTTDPSFYEDHAESVELWSPSSPAFPWQNF